MQVPARDLLVPFFFFQIEQLNMQPPTPKADALPLKLLGQF